MDERVTMQIETDIGQSGSFVHTFTGYLVNQNDNQRVYHSFNADSDVEAVTIQDRDSYILRDNSIEECNIKRKIEWDSKYELQIYGLSIEGKENYIVVTGFLNDSISIEQSDQARAYVDGADTVIVISKQDSFWRFTDVFGDDYESDHYMAEDRLAQDFSSKSDLLRIGFEDSMPESVTVKHP